MVAITDDLFEEQKRQTESEEFNSQQLVLLRTIERLCTQYPWFNGEQMPIAKPEDINPYDILRIAGQGEYDSTKIDFFILPPSFNQAEERYDILQIKQKDGLEKILETGEEVHDGKTHLFPLKVDSFTQSLISAEREEKTPAYLLGVMKIETQSLNEPEKRFYRAYADLTAAGIQRILRVQAFLNQIGQLRESNNILNLVTHDLKNPLTLIDTACQAVLQREELSTKARQRVQGIDIYAREMTGLIESYLSIVRLEKDNKTEYKQTNLGGLILSLIGNNPTVQKRNLTLSKGIEDSLDIEVYTDARRLSALLRNIISNFKYADDNSQVDFYAEKQEEGIELSITTYGRGMNQERAKSIVNGKVDTLLKDHEWKPISQIGLSQAKQVYERIPNARLEIECRERTPEQTGYFTARIFIPYQLQ